MRTRLIALAATLGIAGLVAASAASATTPSGGAGGGVSSGGGGGGSHGGSGGGAGFHGGGGGGYHGGGGHFAGGGFRGGGASYRGGGYGNGVSYVAHANFMAHGGYVSHGSHGYHFVGSQSAGLRGFGTVPHVGNASRISLALGPRMGSAATAVRVDHQGRADHMGAHPGHPGRPGHPHMHPKHLYALPTGANAYRYFSRLELFCEPYYPENRTQPFNPCLTPVKAKAATLR